MNDFFESPSDFDEQIIKQTKAKEEYDKQILSSKKTYVNETALSKTTDQRFDFEKEKKLCIDSLNELKSLSVEEFTFRKKWEEINESEDYSIFQNAGLYKNSIWSPSDINDKTITFREIENLNPKIIVVENDLDDKTWNALRLFCHTAEYNQAPGRFIRFLLIDQTSGKYLGFASIASEVISIFCRDEWLGWTREDKLDHKMLNHSAIGTTIAATQPFGSIFLGGKLMAAMLTTKTVRDKWESDYNSKLVGMTTTSLYGPFSMYNSHKWWKPVGKSKGKIPLKPAESSYETWHKYIKQHSAKEYWEKMTQKKGVSGPVTGAKMRVLAMIFDELEIKQSDYCHGYERGVYFSQFYENTREFLCRKITEDQLVMKDYIKGDIQSVLDWWKPKAISRYLKLKQENRLSKEKLFYDDLKGKSWKDAKDKYLNKVGKLGVPQTTKDYSENEGFKDIDHPSLI